MDYQQRGVRWYWIALYLIFSMGSVYGVLTGNPFLYSRQEFKKELLAEPDQQLLPVPSPTSQAPLPMELGEQSSFDRMNSQRNGMAASDLTFAKSFTEKDVFPLNFDPKAIKPGSWAMDEDGAFIGGVSTAIGFNLSGIKLWEFRFPKHLKEPIRDILLDKALAYVVHQGGEIVALNKKTGALQWNLKLHEELVGPSMISQGQLLVPVKARSPESKIPRPMFRWAVIKRATGEFLHFSKPIEAKPDFHFTFATEPQLILLTSNNRLVAVDPEKLEVVWTQTLTDPVQGPVIVVGDTIFASTLAGKILKLEASKKGRIEWEVDLERPPLSPPSYLPIMTRLSVIDDQGNLRLIDAKLGKPLWTFALENKSFMKQTWSARMKGSVIQEASMEWSHRGWAIWAPCSKNRFCIYNPAKGQLVARVPLAGSLVSFPIEKDKSLYFLVDQGSKWAISHLEQEKHIHAADKPQEKGID
jgi:hypothetical protein